MIQDSKCRKSIDDSNLYGKLFILGGLILFLIDVAFMQSLGPTIVMLIAHDALLCMAGFILIYSSKRCRTKCEEEAKAEGLHG